MFRSTTITRELVLNLAKVMFMLKHSEYYVVICYLVMWQHVTEWRVCCVNITECFTINITLARFSTSSLVMVVDRNMYERYLCVF